MVAWGLRSSDQFRRSCNSMEELHRLDSSVVALVEVALPVGRLEVELVRHSSGLVLR